MQYASLYFSTSKFMGYILFSFTLLKNEVKVSLESIYINQTTWNMCFFISMPEGKTDFLFYGALNLAVLTLVHPSQSVSCRIAFILYIKNNNRDRFNLGSADT